MSKIRKVTIHTAEDVDLSALADRVSQYHADIIDRRLKQSNLTVDQKIEVIDRIIDYLQNTEG